NPRASESCVSPLPTGTAAPAAVEANASTANSAAVAVRSALVICLWIIDPNRLGRRLLRKLWYLLYMDELDARVIAIAGVAGGLGPGVAGRLPGAGRRT